MVSVNIAGLSKSFRSPSGMSEVLGGIHLAIGSGEVLSIRGDNGTGKTVLLNILSGIESAGSGRVEYGKGGARPVIGYVQQDYTSSLLPWFDVCENIALPLRLQGVDKNLRRKKVDETLAYLGFSSLQLDKYPHQLSGGQKQRVAIARALIHAPELLILDEPFANLDAHTTRDLQEVISRIHQERGITIVYVSHELDHCIYLSDRIALLHGRPAKVERCFSVKLPRPRNRTQLHTEAFMDSRSEILHAEEHLY